MPLLYFCHLLVAFPLEEGFSVSCVWVVLRSTCNSVWKDKRWGSCQRLAVLAVEGEGSTWDFKMFSKGGYTGDGSLNLSKELENKISHS